MSYRICHKLNISIVLLAAFVFLFAGCGSSDGQVVSVPVEEPKASVEQHVEVQKETEVAAHASTDGIGSE